MGSNNETSLTSVFKLPTLQNQVRLLIYCYLKQYVVADLQNALTNKHRNFIHSAYAFHQMKT